MGKKRRLCFKPTVTHVELDCIHMDQQIINMNININMLIETQHGSKNNSVYANSVDSFINQTWRSIKKKRKKN